MSARIPSSNLKTTLLPTSQYPSVRGNIALLNIVLHVKLASIIAFRFTLSPKKSGTASPWSWFTRIFVNAMSHPLAAAAMYLLSLITARDIAECTSCPTNLHQWFSLHLRNIRHGWNGKVDTRSRNFALIGERNTWMRWRNMSNLSVLNTMSQRHTLHSQMALQKETIVLFSRWYVRYSIALVLHWNYGLRLFIPHTISGTVFLPTR